MRFRAAKERCDAGYGVGSSKMAVYLDFKYAIERMGKDAVSAKYGNLFQMYHKQLEKIHMGANAYLPGSSLYNGVFGLIIIS